MEKVIPIIRASKNPEGARRIPVVAPERDRRLDLTLIRKSADRPQECSSSGEHVIAQGPEHAQASTATVADCRWRFASVEFDERTLDLRVGGELVEVEPKPLGVLRYLLLHAGEVVTKDELAEAVWPRRILSDSVLAKTVSRLREVLRDDAQNIIKTVHGFGYRLVAQVQVEKSVSPEQTKLNLAAGDHPPLRPLWRLEQRLGSGGHGEAWRARHEKTREQRVFKFALNEASLAALKREITLFRVVNDTLGEQARVVNLLDWNLEQLPYFIEAEYIAGGSLLDWAQARGGLAAIPLPDRLEVVAQIAEAVAAVHSVGVLHKDLKPSNILVMPINGNRIDIRLADFGSGGMLDAKHLESLGITRLGFTRTVTTLDTTSGTPLYLAPEVVAGQPFTVKSDIYALGVILYQLVVGDFRKNMPPGWERGIEDELLREDIAQAAEGIAESRLGDAGGLARSLRGLEARRVLREKEHEAQVRSERVQRTLERERARRVGLVRAFIVLVVGLIVSTTLYFEAHEARQKAEVEAIRADAVNEFLTSDLFSIINDGGHPLKNLTVRELLDNATGKVGNRFASQPQAAAGVYEALGRGYRALGYSKQAQETLSLAFDLYFKSPTPPRERMTLLASQLVQNDYSLGLLPVTLPKYQTFVHDWNQQKRLPTQEFFRLRLEIARGQSLLGQWVQSEAEGNATLKQLASSGVTDAKLECDIKKLQGWNLIFLGRFSEAENLMHDVLLKTPNIDSNLVSIADTQSELAEALIGLGKFDEAEVLLNSSLKTADKWTSEFDGFSNMVSLSIGHLRIEQERNREAIEILKPLIQEVVKDQQVSGDSVDDTPTYREALARAYALSGQISKAEANMHDALNISERNLTSAHPTSIGMRLELVNILLDSNKVAEAALYLDALDPQKIEVIRSIAPLNAEHLIVSGRLLIKLGKQKEGEEKLEQALGASKTLYGTSSVRTQSIERLLNSG